MVQLVNKSAHPLGHGGPTDRFPGVTDHFLGPLQDKAEYVPVDLFLDWVEVKVALLGEGFIGMYIIDNGEVLVDETDGEDLAVITRRFV